MSIDNLLKNIKPKDIKYPGTNKSYEQILKSEAKRFKDILQSKIENYYNSYSPSVYDRGGHGGNLHDALEIDNFCEIDITKNLLTCRVLVNENAIHNSILDNSQANAFWLINDGWEVSKDVWFKDIYRFGYYEGAHYVEDAVEEFESTTKYGIKIEVVRPLLYY